MSTRSRVIGVSVFPSDYELIRQVAESRGLPVATWCRRICVTTAEIQAEGDMPRMVGRIAELEAALEHANREIARLAVTRTAGRSRVIKRFGVSGADMGSNTDQDGHKALRCLRCGHGLEYGPGWTPAIAKSIARLASRSPSRFLAALNLARDQMTTTRKSWKNAAAEARQRHLELYGYAPEDAPRKTPFGRIEIRPKRDDMEAIRKAANAAGETVEVFTLRAVVARARA